MPKTFPNLIIDDIIIERETVTKFLVVLTDENLSWKNHVEVIKNKISKSIGILYRNKEIIDKRNLKQLYFAFIRSYINYASIAWASANKSKLEPLYRRQKHAIRVINLKDSQTPIAPLFLELKALSLYKLNIYNILCLVYKSLQKSCPQSFFNLATKKPPTNLRNEEMKK